MAKKILELKLECISANKNKNGCSLTLANNVQQTKDGPASREGMNIALPDPGAGEKFTPGEKYTVTITEE